MKLLSTAAANTKTAKSELNRPDYTLLSLALSPANSAPGLPSNCPNASPGCISACVSHVGLSNVFKSILEARIRKTVFFRENRSAFMTQLAGEISHERDRAYANGKILAIRPNCFSDIIWERIPVPGTVSTATPHGRSLMDLFPDCQWYDYTKLTFRMHDNSLPENYSLTASWSEIPKHKDACAEILHSGLGNVAIVFGENGGMTGSHAYSQRIPRIWNVAGKDFRVFDADPQDMRFLDWNPRTSKGAKFGRIAGLRLKSSNSIERMKALASGFAVTID